MWIVWVLLLIVVALWIVVKFQEVRASRLLQADWVIQTSLPDGQLDDLVMKAMKGMNPIASISRPAAGVYVREVARGIGERSRNHATFSTTISRTTDDPNRFVVHCEIKNWRGPGFLGIKAMNAVFKARRRIDSVMRAIQAADPSAAVLAHPSLEPTATTGV
jgi:hypothetical protein